MARIKRNPLPEDINLSGCSFAKLTGNPIAGEVLALMIFKQGRKRWFKIPHGWFEVIKANWPKERLGENFPFNHLKVLADKGLVDFDRNECWLTCNGIRRVYELCPKK